ncbi:MAG: SH3 domain-containing protein [Chloroflexi bacterium]|nr:SH3 domain-containing protein [Chloroflexota bacterium]
MKKFRWLTVLLFIILIIPVAHSHLINTPEPVKAQGPVEATVAASGLRIREFPGYTSRTIGNYDLNTVLRIEGRENQLGNGGIWVYGTPVGGGMTGWVLSQYLVFPAGFDVESLPVIVAAGDTPAPVGEAPVVSAQGSRTAANVNFRTGPGLGFSRITTLAPNTPIEPLGRNQSGTWVQAIANGQQGWLYYTLVLIPNGVGSLPVVGDVAATIPVTEAPGGSIGGATTSRVNFRTGPSTGYSIITTLDAGVPVFFTGRNSSNTWFQGTANGREGWLYYTLVRINGNVNSLPVTSGSPSAPSSSSSSPSAPPGYSTANLGVFSFGAHVAGFSDLNRLSYAGGSWVKVQIRYSRGADPNGLSGMINDAHGQGFRILLGIVGHAGDVLGGQDYYNNYANYVAGAAALGADAIEVWNEQNLDREWANGHIDPRAYTQLLATSYNAIKAQNPSTIVISGALAPTGAEGAFGSAAVWNDDRYLAGMRDAGAASYMDCLGAHYNEGIVSPYWTSGDPRGSYYTRYFRGMINTYYGLIRKPVCFTELGYLSPEGFGGLPGHFSWASDVSLGEHAQWLDEAVSIGRSDYRVALIIIWNFNFQGSPGGDPMGGYAMIRPDGSCPACDRLAN